MASCLNRSVRHSAFSLARQRAALIGLFLLATGAGCGVRAEDHLDILYVSSFSSQLPWSSAMLQGAMDEAANGPGPRVRLFVEWMHADRTPPGPEPQDFLDSLNTRYADRTFDGVILDSAEAVLLLDLAETGPLAETPLIEVAALPNDVPVDVPVEIVTAAAHAETLARIPDWLPDTTRLLLIGQGDGSGPGRDFAAVWEAARATLPETIAVERVTHADLNRLTADLALAQPGTVAYFTPITITGSGEQVVPLEVLRRIAEMAAIPIFSGWEQMVGAGIVGGYVLSPERTGRAAVRAIRRATAEREGHNPAPYRDASWASSHLWAFDARQLARFGIAPEALPVGSDIRFRPLPIWESHPYEVTAAAIALAGFLSLTGALIVALARNHRLLSQNRAARNALQAANTGLEERVAARTRDLAAQADRLGRQAHQLELAKASAQAASDAKSRLLSSMSHELRTPLNAVLGFSQMLENFAEPPLTGRSRDWLAAIATAGDQLLTLIDDILDLSRVESGRVRLTPEICPLETLADECVQTLAPMAAAAAATIQTAVTPCSAWADPHRLTQIVTNLLTNAIKYGPEGGRVFLQGGPDRTGTVVLRVADEGPGIPPDQIEQIFWPFYRVNEAADGKGYGLGLALVRTLVTEMGGEVWVEPNQPRGSIFAIRLPAAKVTDLRKEA
ncbi:MAG: hypothetical protein GVY13_07280 [Alphaproteobacteria bacterium]|jgi:signal transduction histidine kinase|nr:hypothetical protein [Alphaproteobacteria bacterium]